MEQCNLHLVIDCRKRKPHGSGGRKRYRSQWKRSLRRWNLPDHRRCGEHEGNRPLRRHQLERTLDRYHRFNDLSRGLFDRNQGLDQRLRRRSFRHCRRRLIGGHREVVEDGASGFIAAEPTPEAVDDALERAWKRLAEWESIGRRARERMLAFAPEDPVADLVEKLLLIIEGAGTIRERP